MQITIDVPEDILEFISKKVEEGRFKSQEEFILHAIQLLSELYGYGGVSFIEKLAKEICPKKKKKEEGELSPEEEFILNLFGKSTFLYPLEIYSLALQESLKMGKTPLPKEKVFELLEGLIKKGYLEKIKRNGDELIKIVKRVENEEE